MASLRTRLLVLLPMAGMLLAAAPAEAVSGSPLGFLDGHRKLLNGDLDLALADFMDALFLSLDVLPRRPEAKL